jgi:hypothetical protein
MTVLALSLFQWFWIALLTFMVGLVSIFALFLIVQLVRNPGHRGVRR